MARNPTKILSIWRFLEVFREGTANWIWPAFVAVSVAWIAVGLSPDEVANRPQFRVDPRSVILTANPGWLCRDLRQDVAAGLERAGMINLLAPGLAERVAALLAQHPWVKSVHWVRPRYPSGLEIGVTFRRPVCFWRGPAETYVFDDDGFLVPASDLCQDQFSRLFEVILPEGASLSTDQHRVRDGRLIESARLASVLGPEVAGTEFRYIRPEVTIHLIDPEEVVLRLLAEDGREILWGHPPARETPGEAAAGAKKDALLRWLREESGSLRQSGIVLELYRP